MDTKTPQQIAVMVADWRERMFTRDGEIRRLIELGQHTQHDSDSYAEHCEAVSSLAGETLSDLVPTNEGREGSRRPSKREQKSALDRTRELMTTNEPESDHLPLMDAAAFETLDAVSALDIARHFLLSMGEVYGRKAAMCADAFATVGKNGDRTATHGQIATGNSPRQPELSTETGPTIAEAWDEYVRWQSATEPAWAKGAPDTPRRAWADFEAVIGKDRRVSGLTKDDARRYQTFADRKPKTRGTRYNTHTMEEILSLTERDEIPLKERRGARTVERDTSAIRSFLRWCSSEHTTKIPEAFEFRTMGNSVPGAPDERYEVWTSDELAKMFDPETLAAYMRKCRTNARKRTGADTPYPDGRQFADFPWVMLIALYSGSRLGEILGLTPNHVAHEHPESRQQSDISIPVFYVEETEERRLKTTASNRCVPIHPDLIELGILDFAASRRELGTDRLLYSAPSFTKAGKWAGKTFRHYTQLLGIHVERVKVFHSFRHGFKTKAAGIMGLNEANAVLGHTFNDSTGGTYIHAKEVPQKERADKIAEMRFPLDLQGLKTMLRALADETE